MNTTIIIIILSVKKAIDGESSVFTEEIEMNPKAPKFKFGDRIRLWSTKIFLVILIPNNGKGKYLWLILCWKLSLGRIELKIQMEKNNTLRTEIVAGDNVESKIMQLSQLFLPTRI